MSRRGTGDGVVAQTASLCREIDECEAEIRSLKASISEMETRHAEQLKRVADLTWHSALNPDRQLTVAQVPAHLAAIIAEAVKP